MSRTMVGIYLLCNLMLSNILKYFINVKINEKEKISHIYIVKSKRRLVRVAVFFGREENNLATIMLLPRHAVEGETIAAVTRDCLDYGKNTEKTGGKYFTAYECDSATVTEEFLLAKAAIRLR